MYRGIIAVIISISLSLLLFACNKQQNNISYTNANQDMILSNEASTINNLIIEKNEDGSLSEPKNNEDNDEIFKKNLTLD